MMLESFEKLKAALLANLAALATAQKPSIEFGAKHLASQDAPPRIVWVPREGRHDKKDLTSQDANFAVKAIWTRHLLIDLHIWAEDETAAEVLANHIVATLEEQLTAGGYSMIGETWPESESTTAGIKMVLTFELRMPWTKERLPLVPGKTLAPRPTGRFVTSTVPPIDPPKGNVA